MTRLQDGGALISSNRWRHAWAGTAPSTIPNQVALSVGEPVRSGDLGNDGVVEAVVPVWCTNGGGTASGQLGHGLVVFTMSHGRPAVTGIIATTEPDTYHTPYFDNSKTRIDADGITVDRLSTEARRRFIDGESAWWNYRLAVCQSRGDVLEGGSAAQIEAASRFLDRSREHLADLNAFDASLSEGR